MASTIQKTHKSAALVTYVIALVCLIAGFFVPFVGKSFEVDNMLALQLPGAFGSAFKMNVTAGKPFLYSYPISFFGLGSAVDFGAYLVLLYALITVVGIVMLIPAALGKGEKPTALNIAFVIEAIALVPLAILTFIQLTIFAFGAPWSWFFTIAAGGTLLMLFVQRLICDGGSAVIKLILLILSVAVLVLVIYPVELIITPLGDKILTFADKLKMYNDLFSDGNYDYGRGLTQVILLFESDYGAYISQGNIKEKLLVIFTLVASLMVFVNLMLDMLGLAKRTNKFMLVANQVRYIIELIAIIGIAIMIPVLKLKYGIMLILFAVIAVIQYIINLIRLLSYKKPEVTETITDGAAAYDYYTAPAEAADENAAAAAPAYAQPAYSQPEYSPAPVAAVALPAIDYAVEEKVEEKQQEAAPVVETRKVVYNVQTIYSGPSDSFLDTLTNEEKIEFSKVFLERTYGKIGNIPQYTVGGDNKKFFSSVFIYYSRVRDYISDGLMNKLYAQDKKM